MSANQPGSNNNAPKLNNGEGGKLQPKFNFTFSQISIQNIGHAGPVRSTSSDFFIEDSAIQTSSVKAPVNPMAWKPVKEKKTKGAFHKPYAVLKPTFIENKPKTTGSMKPLTTIVPPKATPTIEPLKATTTIEPLKATTTMEPLKATTTEPPKATVITEPPKATSIEPPKPTTTTEQLKATTTTKPPKPTTATEPSQATKTTSASVLHSHSSRSNLITVPATESFFKSGSTGLNLKRMRPENKPKTTGSMKPLTTIVPPKATPTIEPLKATTTIEPLKATTIMEPLKATTTTEPPKATVITEPPKATSIESPKPTITTEQQKTTTTTEPPKPTTATEPSKATKTTSASVLHSHSSRSNLITVAAAEPFFKNGSTSLNLKRMRPEPPVVQWCIPADIPKSFLGTEGFNAMRQLRFNFQTQATCENINPFSTINNQFNMQPVNPVEAKITVQPQGIPESGMYNPMKVMGNFPNTGNGTVNFQTKATCENISPVSTINNQFNMQPVNPVEAKITVKPQGVPESDMYNSMKVMGNFPNTGNGTDNKCYEFEGIESPNLLEDSGNRVSAFKRLGPVTHTKKPKLTINLLFSKNEPVREVVDETEKDCVANSPEVYIPVHKRRDILLSVDELVIKYLPMWPWKKMCYSKIIARPQHKKELMLEELKTMKNYYSKPDDWIHVQITGFPAHYDKNYVLDALLENLKNEHFVPCFIEHNSRECNFLVLTTGSQNALISLHDMGLVFIKNSCVFDINIRYHDQSLRDSLSFHPILILERRLTLIYRNYKKSLDLSSFCMQADVSHFLYFPLNRVANQYELMELPTSISWENLQEINLSHNRLQSIEGFQLHKKTPNLRVLDLSYNYIDNITALIQCHGMPLHSFKLEGNPLCTDFTDPEHYITVARMLFPCLKCLDDVPLRRAGDIPSTVRNYCPEHAKELVDSFLGLYFPLLDSEPTERIALEEMYDDNAMWSLTFPSRMRLDFTYRRHKELFSRFRNIDDGCTDHLTGHKTIARHLVTWPPLQHDYYSFSVDVLYHTDSKTILKISGLMKVLVKSLLEDEPLLVFHRTVVLGTEDGMRYRIQNEMVSWNLPSLEMVRAAFKQAPVQLKTISLKLDQPPDDKLKKKLIELFMKVSDLDSHESEGCLELRNWNFKDALEYFMEMVRLGELKVVSEDSEEQK